MYKLFEPMVGKGLITAPDKVSLTKYKLIIFNYSKKLLNN